MRLPRLMIAGVGSGVGKTTVATGLMATLTRRGLRVQGYKAGPDYIDPQYHRLATGRPSRNLDTRFFSPEQILELLTRSANGADITVIEGVMGLFDGVRGRGEEGSSAHLAKLLEAPVVLVTDVRGMARSAAALVLGYREFDPAVRLAGVILNGASGASHAGMVREAVEAATGVPVLGWLPRQAEVRLPERHLGLVPPGESGAAADRGFVDGLADLVAGGMDLERVLALAATAPELPLPPSAIFPAPSTVFPARSIGGAPPVRIGLARDDAFNFYYQDALELLEALGAELIPFSPLADTGLPEGLDGLYIGGGFPEEFAAALAANAGMRADLREAADSGMPVYAECGGLLLLCRALVDRAGREHEMVGLVPARAVMTGRLAGFGYKEAEALAENLLMPAGQRARGHEFHHARLAWAPPAAPNAYRLRRPSNSGGSGGGSGAGGGSGGGGAGVVEGWAAGNLLASFCHLHFCADPALARRFIQRCEKFKQQREALNLQKGEILC